LPKLVRSAELAQSGLESAPSRVDCLLIVERDELVDLLVRNGAHEQLCTLVISESGYPAALVPEARRLLDERSDLRVVALHDASQRGIELKSRLHASAALPLAEREILDAGLFAAEVGQIEELAAAFPASAFTQAPVDALSLSTLLAGLSGVTRGAFSLSAGIYGELPASGSKAERAA
jgi:hypothetical protein